jgi:hypothetical protein
VCNRMNHPSSRFKLFGLACLSFNFFVVSSVDESEQQDDDGDDGMSYQWLVLWRFSYLG